MVTLIWAIMFVLFVVAGFVGFELNVSTPIQVGPLPFVCFVMALVALVVVIARLAT